MPDDHDDMHASGFPEPDGPHPIGGLSVDAGVTRWTCTHAELAAALHRTRQCRWMNEPALATMAREILAQLPEAIPDAEISRLKVYITHLNAEIADKSGRLAMLTKGDT